MQKGNEALTKIIPVCLLILFAASAATAQVNPVYRQMLRNGWSYPFKNGFRMLTSPEIDSEFCRSMGYNSNTVDTLEKSGIRVVGRWKKRGPWGSKLWTALSDCIVIGSVSKIEHPSWAKPFYNSVVYVEVDSFLRNDYDLAKGRVAVMQISGPTGTGLIAIDSQEPRWSIGEHVLLFLSASQLITFAANNDMQKLYSQLINSPEIRFQLIARLGIKFDDVLCNGKRESLKREEAEIDNVLDVIRHFSTRAQ